MNQEEIPFVSGESKQKVVRVGDTVRKEPTENRELIREVMIQLAEDSFQYSPRYLGIDDKGREMMTYIDGQQMNHTKITIALMKQAVEVLREFHDILSVSELSGEEETLLHTDFAPWNLIVNGDKLVGVVDFDDVKPGKRIYDVAYICWNLLDIGSKDSDFSEEEIYKYLPILLDSYGEIEPSDFVYALLSEQHRILKRRERRVWEVEEGQERENRKQICVEISKQIEWVKENRENIKKALKQKSHLPTAL
jgi:thiamine kinase-like enzyme